MKNETNTINMLITGEISNNDKNELTPNVDISTKIKNLYP